MSSVKFKVRLGDATKVAANLDSHSIPALAQVERGCGWIRGTRDQLLEILYYIESAVPFLTGDGQSPVERSAVLRTSQSWRSVLGLAPCDSVPVPSSASRIPGSISDQRILTERAALHALEDHMDRFSGQILTRGTFASEQFDRLYLEWIRARWDDHDAWVRSIWTVRP